MDSHKLKSYKNKYVQKAKKIIMAKHLLIICFYGSNTVECLYKINKLTSHFQLKYEKNSCTRKLQSFSVCFAICIL